MLLWATAELQSLQWWEPTKRIQYTWPEPQQRTQRHGGGASRATTVRVEMGPRAPESLERHCAPQGLRLHLLQRLPFLQHLQDIPPNQKGRTELSQAACLLWEKTYGDVDVDGCLTVSWIAFFWHIFNMILQETWYPTYCWWKKSG